MVPPFNDSGLLPPGIHRATTREFEDRFVSFNRSDRRIRLYASLQRLMVAARKIPFVKQILIAGSFVTAKPEPNDFDCLLVLDGNQFPAELRPFEYQVMSRRAASKEFGGDVIPVVAGSDLHSRYLDFFQTTREGSMMGIVELMP